MYCRITVVVDENSNIDNDQYIDIHIDKSLRRRQSLKFY